MSSLSRCGSGDVPCTLLLSTLDLSAGLSQLPTSFGVLGNTIVLGCRIEPIWPPKCEIWSGVNQALEKLLLAEGSKMVMVAFQSSYYQGVYGLVSNLGSLVVRTIFQVIRPPPPPGYHPRLPELLGLRMDLSACMSGYSKVARWSQPFEEAAFLAFSRWEPGLGARDAAAQRSRVLAISTRCVTIVGASSCASSVLLILSHVEGACGLHACSQARLRHTPYCCGS